MAGPLVSAGIQTIPALLAYLGKQGWFGGQQNSEVTQKPMETPEQTQARQMLLGMAGESSGGSGALSTLEKSGQSMLEKMMAGGNPEAFDAGKAEIMSVLQGNNYDPTNPSGVYGGMKRGILKERDEALDVVNRDAARTGRLSSTWRGNQVGKVATDASNKLTDVIADLTERYANRRLGAATAATGIGTAEENMNMNRIGAAYSAGGLERSIGQNIEQTNITNKQNALRGVIGSTPNYGVDTVQGSNPWDALMQQALFQFGGNMAKKYA